jgi:hypothetical protein
MMTPDVQGELLLSLLAERREQFERDRLTTARQTGRPHPARRLLLITGNILISLGNAIKNRGDIDLGRPDMTTEWSK